MIARIDDATIALVRERADIAGVARDHGVQLRRHGRGFRGLCPLHQERTPSFDVDPRRGLYHCHGCQEGGDAIDLVMRLDGLTFSEAVRALADRIGVTVASATIEHALREEPRQERRPFPPAAEVRAFWENCIPITRDPAVGAWVRSRGLDLAIVEHLNLVRALAVDTPLPRWASYMGDAEEPRPWTALGYRAIVPVYDAAGDLRSVRARYVGVDEPPDGVKALPPCGHGIRGLVLACPLGRMMLSCGRWPWWAAGQPIEVPGEPTISAPGGAPVRLETARGCLVITEGEPDHLTWATQPPIPRTIAVLGIAGPGQWDNSIADRIPAGTIVVLRTDEDDAGDAYAAEIAASLRGRCDVRETSAADRAARRKAKVERDEQRRAEARRGRGQTTIPEVR